MSHTERSYGNDSKQINRMNRLGNIIQPLNSNYNETTKPDCITCKLTNCDIMLCKQPRKHTNVKLDNSNHPWRNETKLFSKGNILMHQRNRNKKRKTNNKKK